MPADDGYGMTKSQLQGNPALDDFLQLPAAFFQGFASGPYALQLGNLAIKGLRVIDDLVGGLVHCCLDVFCEHRNNILSDQIKPFASYSFALGPRASPDPVHVRALAGGRLTFVLVRIWALTYARRESRNIKRIFTIKSGDLMLVKFEVYFDGENWCARGIGISIFTQGKSLDELMDNVKEAISLHFEDVLEAGEEIRVLSISEFEVHPVAKASGC